MRILNPDIDIGQFFKKIHLGSLLMLDYDGTLAPFVDADDRMQAYPYPGVKERLQAMMQAGKTRTVIISGRSLSDLEKLLDLPKLELWGSHGLERKLPNGKKVYAELDDKLRQGLGQGIKVCRENVGPQYCEIKSYAVALHWRGMDQKKGSEAMEKVEGMWQQICLSHGLEIHRFDGGIELRPKGRNKGDAIAELLGELQPNAAVAYLGDDVTDEEAFAELKNRGLKVLVRQQFRPTLADIFLIPPQELLAFFDQWLTR